MNCLAIYRAERFSPNSVERDRAIMDAVCKRLRQDYNSINVVKEEDISNGMHFTAGEYPLILSMARSQSVLNMLAEEQKRGAIIINSPQQMLNMSRSRIDGLMRENGIPCAPINGSGGWWIKRGDEAAQEKGDVRFANDETEKGRIIKEFHERGITDIVTTAHVDGDLVKFYGVTETGFFFTSYPADTGYSKFGDEQRNGSPRYTPFCKEELHKDATTLARLTGIYIYGGDCIVRSDGSYAIIDFNDWPSFSACREEAAHAIALRAKNIYINKVKE